MDILTAVTLGNSVVEVSILVLLVYWFKFDKKQARKRPRKPKTIVVQTVVPKEAVE